MELVPFVFSMLSLAILMFLMVLIIIAAALGPIQEDELAGEQIEVESEQKDDGSR